MTTALPSTEQTEAIIERRGTRIPGLAALRATAGFQRGMLLVGALLVLFFVVIAVFAAADCPVRFRPDVRERRRLPDVWPRRRPSTGSARP